MKAKASVIAQKLLNLYRQAHVINGGWKSVNRVFIDEATDEVLQEMADLPTGQMLVQHIKNLRDGKTPMDSIARELLPYGGMMDEAGVAADMSPDDMDALLSAIDDFEPDQDALQEFMHTPIVRKFGPEWATAIKNMLTEHPDALKKFDTIVRTWRAYKMWDSANEIISKPINERARAQLQVDMLDYETYLPMFGNDGNKLLRKLHKITSSLPQTEHEA